MKKKQNTWAIISLLGVAIILLGGFWLLFLRPNSPGNGDAGLNWYTVHLFADQSGWAITSQGVLHTQDGGQHWTIVSPPTLGSQSFDGLPSDFLDARNAWLIKPSSTQYIQSENKQPPANAQLFHTSDGGKTWQESDIPDTSNTYSDIRSGPGLALGAFRPLTPLGEDRRMVSINQIVAPDSHTVWVAVSCSSVHTGGGEEIYRHIYSRLWRSSDGGQHWEKAWEDTTSAFPDGSGTWLTLIPNTGERLMSGPTLSDLLLTRDGTNWQPTTLPVQDMSVQDRSLSHETPATFFNNMDGVIVITTPRYISDTETQYTFRFFFTYDEGQHWQQSSSVPLLQFQGTGSQATIAFLDRTHWLIASQGVLWHSDDGGQSWQRYQPVQGSSTLISPSFLSPSEGWAIGQTLRGKVFVGTLLHTRDGGKTWEPMNAQMSS